MNGVTPMTKQSRAFAWCAVVAMVVAVTSCSRDPEAAKREYVKSGDRFAEQQQFQEAIVQYRNALQQDAQFGEARSKLAQTYEKLGDLRNT